MLGAASGLPSEALDVLQRLSASNEGRLPDKLALLERRLTVPPSPAVSQGAGSLLINQNSVHSVTQQPSGAAGQRHATPSISNTQLPAAGPQEGGRSLDGTETSSEHPSKRRRVQQQQPAAEQPLARTGSKPMGGGGCAASPPAPQQQHAQQQKLSPFLADNSRQGQPAASAQPTPGSSKKQKNTISRYFPTVSGGAGAVAGGDAAPRRPAPSPAPSDPQAPAAAAVAQTLQLEAQRLREDNARLQGELERAAAEQATLSSSVERLEAEAAAARQASSSRDESVRSALLCLCVKAARQERELTLQRLQAAAPRLGCLGVRRHGIHVQEVWEEGQAFKDVHTKLRALAQQRESIEAARKAAKKRLPLPGQVLPAAAAGGGSEAAAPGSMLHPDDWVVQEEIYKQRLAALKREEDMLRSELARLEAEKVAHISELKCAKDEEASRFSSFPVLHGRYLLLKLLGRGGFSEVFKAFDLVDLREVACKIHQLNSQWTEARKASYVKHSVREYHIHKELKHPRIVSLVDIFEIDNNTFATVLELVEGGDLDAYCKLHETLPEKEAKTIVAQILAGLVYLNTKPRSVIHYDLKPANILFDRNGECKITDFGLSKVVDEGQTQGMELTSQGAGTYWYLPPECFVMKPGAAPIISNKVDVWSVGVIFYQMLFGRRPFGHEQSQEQILRNEVMLNAREVAFPTRPAISPECKDFIRRCLAYRQEDRLDVHAAAAHPYMSFKKAPKATAAAKEAAAAAAKEAAAAAAGAS
ncbi:hypothetical protein ABPG75_010222 [Micractinium tetrahymenae]